MMLVPLRSVMVKLALALVPLTTMLPDPPMLLDQDISDKPKLSVAATITVMFALVVV